MKTACPTFQPDKRTVTAAFSDWLLLITPVHLQTPDVSRSRSKGRGRPLTASLPLSSHQDERGDVRYAAVMDHRTDVCPPARHDEASFAGLPQPGPEGRGPDEKGSRADKHRRPAEDGN